MILRIKRLEIKSREAPRRAAPGRHHLGTGTFDGGGFAGTARIILAVLAVIFREEKLLAGIAVTLGAAAIAVQIWWVLVIVAFAMIIANAFLSFLS